ncbi:hypothetical protein ACLB2K_005119 [Fragaria x ananassa]
MRWHLENPLPDQEVKRTHQTLSSSARPQQPPTFVRYLPLLRALRIVTKTATVKSMRGCGVLGSKIVFASGLKPNSDPVFGFPFGPLATTDAYAFDVHDPSQGIGKIPTLNGGKHKPLMTEFAGKLYVPSLKEYNTFVSFEVFDPQQGTWSRLPKYPNHGLLYSYAIVGTKLFMSTPVPEGDENYYRYCLKHDPSIRCFDLSASDPEWRSPQHVPRRPFPVYRPSSSGLLAAARTQ